MPEFIPVLGKNEIQNIVAQIARKISSDYQGQELILIGVLKGAFIFLSDLVRHLSIPVKVDFVGVSSYGSGTTSSGIIRLTRKVEIDLTNKDVLVIEDIVDTGLTLTYIVDYLKTFSPKTVKVCALLDKRERRSQTIKIDYACHVVSEGFLVGYGLDYNEDYRELPEVYHLKF
ncbi:MAG: hypoxanthine phosphoribosyltransferase [Pseudomonadota bacterium]|uniref:Hypoxanthine phosphoribosyltransferase n=1 Tax=Candidatus Desulfatibia profunda TaxID=2841695 RepID=A0A8J6NNU0_9BACT|nr:hypoxanthine phosphoribosyltransferase [Candidatus Desulfatibia profunda]MBL7180164.1 hypoxanthine phosphoribosyltransferase [Desulfobacterales bacterium]MBU0698964.1 hypoxanthine phosphoribosyltransferase [Pseudomonadota bacterium]